MTGKKVSTWWVAPDLLRALESGKTFAEWLDGRIPVGSYGRITSDSAKDKHGVTDQHGHNRRRSRPNGLAIVKHYDDNDANASKPEITRDAFELMVREIGNRRTGEGFPIQGVMCLERERLYRRAGDYERIVDALMVDDDGILYESGDPGRFFDLYSDSAEFDGLIGVAASKREVRKVSRRMKDRHAARTAEGIAVGGPRRFGYLGCEWRHVDGEKQVIRRSNEQRHPDEWPHLTWMIRQAVAGKAWLTIAEELNKRGVRTARGGEWSGDAVRNLVSNPILYGYRRNKNGEIVTGENGAPLIGAWDKAGTPKQWEAICERIRQARAQKGLPVENADYSPGSMSTRTRRYLFSGFLRCGRMRDGEMCNHKLTGKPRTDGRGHFYGCRKKGNLGCGGLGRDGAKADEYLTELVLRKHEEIASRKVRAVPEPWEKADKLAAAEKKLARLRREWRADIVTDDFFYAELPGLENTVKTLHREYREWQGRQEAKAARGSVRIRERWADMDLAQKRAAIGEVLSAVIVLPLPKGTPKNGPFDPSLLRPVWKRGASVSVQVESVDVA